MLSFVNNLSLELFQIVYDGGFSYATIYARRFISTLMLDIPFVYSILDMYNTFFGGEITNMETWRAVAIVGQCLTTIVYWTILHEQIGLDFRDRPVEWFRWAVSHGVPLITLLYQQHADPYVWDWDIIYSDPFDHEKNVIFWLMFYPILDIPLTIILDQPAYFFLPWNTNPEVAFIGLILVGLVVAGMTAVLVYYSQNNVVEAIMEEL